MQDLTPQSVMSHAESLFLSTLRDLASRVGDTDKYNVLGASALIRKLLIDGSPLVDQVNQQHRLKLSFEICESNPSIPGVPEPTFWSAQDGLDPETSRPGKPRKAVNRDQLLATILAVIDSKSYTLRDIVLFEANVMGGVHAGSPKEDKEKALQTINSTLAIGGSRSAGSGLAIKHSGRLRRCLSDQFWAKIFNCIYRLRILPSLNRMRGFDSPLLAAA